MKTNIALLLLLTLSSTVPSFAAEKEPEQLSEVPSSIKRLEAMAHTQRWPPKFGQCVKL
jgi:hypothetical protein